MQVSWIDPDEVAKLAAQLEGPLQLEETASWDVDTLPDFSKLFTLDQSVDADSAKLADAMAAPPPESLDHRGSVPAPELEHIREKLRAIRSRAQEAGMLSGSKAAELPPEISEITFPTASPGVSPAEMASVDTGASSDPPSFPDRFPSPVAAEPEPAISTPAFSAPEFSIGGTLSERLPSYMSWAGSIAPCEDILLVDDHGDLLWGASSRADLALSVVLAAGAGLRGGGEALTRSSVFIRSRLGAQQELSVIPCPTRHGLISLALLNATCLGNETAAHLRQVLTSCVNECRDATEEVAGHSPS